MQWAGPIDKLFFRFGVILFSMLALSINFWGLGTYTKQNWIRDCFNSNRINVLGIQETKMEVINCFLARSIWGSYDFIFAFSPSIGSSGGTALLWDSSVFTKEIIFIGAHYSGVLGCWEGVSSLVVIITVYGPQSVRDKAELGSELVNITSVHSADWMIFSDFNAIRSHYERSGSIFVDNDALLFNEFIANSGLLDLQLGGRRYTWFHR